MGSENSNDILTAEERLALAQAVLRYRQASMEDVEFAYEWARTIRRLTQMLDGVLNGTLVLGVEGGFVTHHERANG